MQTYTFKGFELGKVEHPFEHITSQRKLVVVQIHFAGVQGHAVGLHDRFEGKVVELLLFVVDACPVELRILSVTGTGDEGRDIDTSRVRHETTFSGDRDGGADVVASDHSASEMSGSQGMNVGCRARFELVFKDDKAEEMEVALGDFALHPLGLEPSEIVDRLAGNGDDSESVSRVVRQHVVIVVREGRWVANVGHDFGSTLAEDFHAVGLETLDDDAHSTKGRDKVKGPDDTEFEELGFLLLSAWLTEADSRQRGCSSPWNRHC